jgi:hypothetical protein
MKAQIKMMETIAVLLVFFFLFAFGIQLYGSTQVSELKRMQSQFLESNAQKLADSVSGSAFLRCSEVGIDKGNCIDKYKLQAIIEIIKSAGDDQSPTHDTDKDAYDKLVQYFGRSTIEIEYIYPVPASDSKPVVIYDVKPAVFSAAKPVPIPVVVFNPITRAQDLAILWVTSYDTN